MIPVAPVRQPRGFKAAVEDLGAPHVAEYLANGKELPRIWAYPSKRKYLDKLREGFGHLCGYSAICTTWGSHLNILHLSSLDGAQKAIEKGLGAIRCV